MIYIYIYYTYVYMYICIYVYVYRDVSYMSVLGLHPAQPAPRVARGQQDAEGLQEGAGDAPWVIIIIVVVIVTMIILIIIVAITIVNVIMIMIIKVIIWVALLVSRYLSKATCLIRPSLNNMKYALVIGWHWHYLSNATCLTRHRLFYALLVASRITVICKIVRHFWRKPALDK